jgi:proteasome beta subunit
VTWPDSEKLAFNSPISRASAMDSSSFSEMLRQQAPHLLPAGRAVGSGGAPGPSDALPHGTTIVALKFPGGVLIAGDRRSTQGNMIAGRDVKKVYVTDDYTATGIAGTAAIAVEFSRLYAVELEHYEKVEGVPMTFAGKVNRLAIMVRGNLGAALQGFVALPLLVGYDLDDPDSQRAGRIVSFDAAGGWNIEIEGYQSVGSGSVFAKSSIKKLYSRVSDAESGLRVAVESLYDAADDDSATGGPDLVRGIYPTAVIIGAEGAEDVSEARIAELAREVVESRSRANTFLTPEPPTDARDMP